MTPAHGAALARGEVNGRRLLKCHVPELVAAGLPAGPAVDVEAALDTIRGRRPLADRFAAARAWTGASLTAAGASIAATATGVGKSVSSTASHVAANPAFAPFLNTLGHAFAGGAGWSAGSNVGTRVSNAALDALRIGKK